MRTKLPFIFVIITVMLDSMGLGLVMPVLPDLITEIHGGTVSAAAVWGGFLAFMFSFIKFVFGSVFCIV